METVLTTITAAANAAVAPVNATMKFTAVSAAMESTATTSAAKSAAKANLDNSEIPHIK